MEVSAAEILTSCLCQTKWEVRGGEAVSNFMIDSIFLDKNEEDRYVFFVRVSENDGDSFTETLQSFLLNFCPIKDFEFDSFMQ